MLVFTPFALDLIINVRFLDAQMEEILYDVLLFPYFCSTTSRMYVLYTWLTRFLLEKSQPLPLNEKLSVDANSWNLLAISYAEHFALWSY